MLTVITSSYSCTKTLERMSYRPMEILSFHSSLSTEFWKLHKSASVPKVGHHRRREGQRLGPCRGREACAEEDTGQACEPIPQSASAHTPPITGLSAVCKLEQQSYRRAQQYQLPPFSTGCQPTFRVLSTASITVSQDSSMKITLATKKSFIVLKRHC